MLGWMGQLCRMHWQTFNLLRAVWLDLDLLNDSEVGGRTKKENHLNIVRC